MSGEYFGFALDGGPKPFIEYDHWYAGGPKKITSEADTSIAYAESHPADSTRVIVSPDPFHTGIDFNGFEGIYLHQ